jgi:prepilin-type N-terminal cleavage/methylation domain-containing protein
MRKIQTRLNGRQAFTLVEMMIVVAIIAVLIGGVFRMMSAAGEKNKESTTVTRIERLQNALSGYYAEYGSYPPVKQIYEYPDPEYERPEGDRANPKPVDFTSESANKAARSQSIAYEFPPLTSLDEFIMFQYKSVSGRSAGQVFGGQNLWAADDSWTDWNTLQLFKFGLLSYLLPRAHIAWGSSDQKNDRYSNVFKSKQWATKNPEQYKIEDQIAAQMEIEKRTVARWLPNFEKIIYAGNIQMGIDLHEKDTPAVDLVSHNAPGSSQVFLVQTMTIRDGWGKELYYYSPAPYQSYRIWSSGRDGKTFPPWIPLKDYKYKTQAAQWIEDDIVRFDH